MDAVVQRVSAYIVNLFHEHPKSELTFHNVAHTIQVVNRVKEMIGHYGLNADEGCIVQVAAWFHDIGYLFSGYWEHEKESVALMNRFLPSLSVDKYTIERIAVCIMCTRLPANPNNLLEEIICDADTYHLGTEKFWESDEAVKQEFKLSRGITNIEWDIKTLQFLKHHQFFTGYCQQRLNTGKQANIEMLLARIRESGSNRKEID